MEGKKFLVKDFGIWVSLLKEKHKISFKRDMQTGLGVCVCVCVLVLEKVIDNYFTL